MVLLMRLRLRPDVGLGYNQEARVQQRYRNMFAMCRVQGWILNFIGKGKL